MPYTQSGMSLDTVGGDQGHVEDSMFCFNFNMSSFFQG